MQNNNKCPLCKSVHNDILHSIVIKDNYPALENKIQRTNNYRRNYILFEKVLKRSVNQIKVDFKLCNKCGFIYFTPRPDQIDLNFKYDDIVKTGITFEMEKAHKLIDIRQLRAKQIFKKVSPHIKKQSGRILDVGGADGHCMTFFTNDYSCEVLDFESRSLVSGVKKIGETLIDLKKTDLFDLIITSHTLEHIPDISKFTDSLRNHLSEEGIIYIEVPYGCYDEIYKTSNLLTHINFFSEGSLGFLLNQARLTVQYINSGPTLSSKRYLPVISAIARKANKVPENYINTKEAYLITKSQMKLNIAYYVLIKNILLVLSHPVKYSHAYLRKVLSRII
jgi:hypothetical protein